MRVNIIQGLFQYKDIPSRYGDFQYKDKKVMRLYIVNP